MRYTRFGISLFTLAVVAGPLYTVPEYSAVRNLVSELAAQNAPRNWLMSTAFIVLGACIAADGAKRFARHLVPFMAFGLFMALAGLFGHKPINPDAAYVAWVHSAHSALATVAGVSITLALAWQAFRQPLPAQRAIAGALAVVCLALPLTMLWFPPLQGLVQRTMYALIFAWLWLNYPEKTHA